MSQPTTIHHEQIADSFGKKAAEYHKKAEIQRKVANGLMASLKPWKAIIPPGPILEVGCGTGILSEQIIQEFPNREVILSDISSGMIRFCEERLQNEGHLSDQVSFQQLNAGEEDPVGMYSLIISNFTIQWMNDPALGLEKLTKKLKPGGILLCSFPGEKSFPEWYEKCLELGLPYTANPLPNVEKLGIHLSMGPVQIDFYENEITQKFESSIGFFRHLKDLGASLNVQGKQLTSRQFRLLTKHWDSSEEQIKVTWHTVYLAAKKEDI